jgi:hypothetical protein
MATRLSKEQSDNDKEGVREYRHKGADPALWVVADAKSKCSLLIEKSGNTWKDWQQLRKNCISERWY